MWRLRRKVFRGHLERFGEDLPVAVTLALYAKMATYNLNYRDRAGNLKPVRFGSHIWKRIDGMALDYIERERRAGCRFDVDPTCREGQREGRRRCRLASGSLFTA
jgi:hypothetical protein